MKRTTPRDSRADTFLGPSPFVRRFASKIVDAAASKAIVDVACGSGRNAMLLSELGCTTICVDKDLTRLEAQLLRLHRSSFRMASTRLILQQLDLVKDPWPFGPHSIGGIVNVHFLLPTLFPLFGSSLSPGGYLLLETVPGCGGNYLELPKAGEVRRALEQAFHFELYVEGKVGPRDYDAVTVRVLARRRESPASIR
jgi:hypothetical protein